MVTIKNEYLEAQFDPKGAEISKIIGMQDGINYMWKQDPCLWDIVHLFYFQLLDR